MQTFNVPSIGMMMRVYGDTETPDTAIVNASTLMTRAQNALTNNQSFLALTNPTNAQTLAQVRALTRQMDGLIRFLLNQFDSIADS